MSRRRAPGGLKELAFDAHSHQQYSKNRGSNKFFLCEEDQCSCRIVQSPHFISYFDQSVNLECYGKE